MFLLLAGSHRHRYTGTSGVCTVCHRMHSPHEYVGGVCVVCGFAGCEHPDGFTDNGSDATHACPVCGATSPHAWVQDATATRCKRCEVCGAEIPHDWAAGVCQSCGYVCLHPSWTVGEEKHVCNVCGVEQEHQYELAHESLVCRRCSVCSATVGHELSNPSPNNCGSCGVCGDSFSPHVFVNGKCRRCGYICLHPQGLDSQGYCSFCNWRAVMSGATYYIYSGLYAGSYLLDGSVNGQQYYRQYVNRTGAWVPGNYYAVVLDITTPTQFGGDYAYTGSGTVFVTTVASFPINSELLSGSGKWHVHLRQFELDGTFKAEAEYTSPDCDALIGVPPQ